MSSGSRKRIARRPAGSSDPWQVLRSTGDTLTVENNTTRSEEIRDDGTRGDVKTVMINPNGSVSFEFSAANFDSIMSSVLRNTWTDDTLVNGTDDTRWEYLASHMDLDIHVLFEDASDSQLQLTANAGEKVTGEVTIMARGHDDEYDPSTDTFEEPEATVIMDASNNMHTILIDGDPPSGLIMKAFNITINGSYQSDQAVGSLYQHHQAGSFDITGSVNFRYSTASMDLWRKGLRSDPVSLGFTLSEGDYSYVKSLPRLFLSGSLPGGGLDTILDQPLDITAARNSEGVMMQIDRTVPETP